MPGMAAKGACVYEHALMWALEAEKLDLPQLSAVRALHCHALEAPPQARSAD